MKKGRKPLNEDIKKQKMLDQLWKGNFLNLNLLEQLKLLNINFPQSKQIFTKDLVIQYKKQKNYRYVKIISSNLLIDCRTIRNKETQKENQNEIFQEQMNQNQQQQSIQSSNVQNNQEQPLTTNFQNPSIQNNIEQLELPSVIEILPQQQSNTKENMHRIPQQQQTHSSNQSVIEIQSIPVIISNKDLINDENEQISNSNLQSLQSKTQNTKNLNNKDQIPQNLEFEPSSPNSPSLSFSKALSESFAYKFMDESFFEDDQFKLSESLFGNVPKIKKDSNTNLYDSTFNLLKAKINDIQQFQYDQLLTAYNHNFLHIQKVIFNDLNQIKLLISKYKLKKPRII